MAPHSRPVGSDNKENQTDASSDLTEIFSDNSFDSDSISDLELDSEDSDMKMRMNPMTISLMMRASCLLSPEHYLAQAESLNVSQLRQKQHSDTTQERLNENPHILE